jgi:hypothetical protein
VSDKWVDQFQEIVEEEITRIKFEVMMEKEFGDTS